MHTAQIKQFSTKGIPHTYWEIGESDDYCPLFDFHLKALIFLVG